MGKFTTAAATAAATGKGSRQGCCMPPCQAAQHKLRRLLLLLLLCAAWHGPAGCCLLWAARTPCSALAPAAVSSRKCLAYLGDGGWPGIEQGAGDLADWSLGLTCFALGHLHLDFVDHFLGLGVLLEVTVICVLVTVQAGAA